MKCQLQNFFDSGGRLKVPIQRRVKNFLKRIPGVSTILRFWSRQRKPQLKVKVVVSPEQEVLNLKVGEWVEVRTPEEIKATLDENNSFDRTVFMQGMWNYCGKRFRVFKRIENILDYRNGNMWKVRNSVIFQGVYCEKDPTEFYECDQTCFYYWKEAWLKRIDPPDIPNSEQDGFVS